MVISRYFAIQSGAASRGAVSARMLVAPPSQNKPKIGKKRKYRLWCKTKCERRYTGALGSIEFGTLRVAVCCAVGSQLMLLRWI